MASEKLKILHIDSEKYWRGGQQQVFYLHQGLINRGIYSDLVCSEDSELKKKCKSNDLPYKAFKIFGEIDLFSAFKISKICKNNGIKIIHAHSAHALSIGILSKLFYRTVILIGVRRVDFPINKNFLSRKKYNTEFIDRIVCISDFIKQVLISDNIAEEKLVTIKSGVDLNKFDNISPGKGFRENLGINKGEFLLGTVAAFAGHKDYPNLLKSFALIRQQRENVKLCMVGDGPLKNEMLNLAKELNIDDSIIVPGFRKDIGKFLKIFDLFILASKKEGLGTSIIDALSIGLPIVATKAGGIPELIEDGQNGRLVDTQNPSLIAQAVIELIDSEEKRSKMATKAKLSAAQFSIENTIEQNISLYKKLLDFNQND